MIMMMISITRSIFFCNPNHSKIYDCDAEIKFSFFSFQEFDNWIFLFTMFELCHLTLYDALMMMMMMNGIYWSISSSGNRFNLIYLNNSYKDDESKKKKWILQFLKIKLKKIKKKIHDDDDDEIHQKLNT